VVTWLDIQNEELLRRGARPWGRADFCRELTRRRWWRPECLLFAVLPETLSPVGCVALELTGGGQDEARLHWLAVVRAHRRRGIAHALLDRVEQVAATAGYRRLVAETLRDWDAAMRFYLSLGFDVQQGPPGQVGPPSTSGFPNRTCTGPFEHA
jgi:GNAT superfamily N-acetyltransferase